MADPANTKVCRGCGAESLHTLEFFRPMNGGPALRSTCRDCERAKARRSAMTPERDALYQARVQRRAETRRKRYADDEAYRTAVLERVRADRVANPDRHREWDRKNRINNRAPGSAFNKRKYARLDKAAKRTEHKAWRLANPERLRAMALRSYAKNRDKHRARANRWAKKNPDAGAAARARRRARLLGALGSYTKNDVRELILKYGKVCFYCASALEVFQVDHFIPLAKGGSNFPSNLRISCARCNYSKGAKLPWEWKPERFLCEEAA